MRSVSNTAGFRNWWSSRVGLLLRRKHGGGVNDACYDTATTKNANNFVAMTTTKNANNFVAMTTTKNAKNFVAMTTTKNAKNFVQPNAKVSIRLVKTLRVCCNAILFKHCSM